MKEWVDWLQEAAKYKMEMVRLRRQFHMNPELGTEETETVEVVRETLESLGIATNRLAGTGLVGLLTGGKPGKTVALRADMDALPLQDLKTVEYASRRPGKMHACGHDAHTAGLLGAAMLLSKYRDSISGQVKFLFQPAEETVGGALPMIEAGAMENPRVDAVFGLHATPELRVGKIGFSYGKTYAASDDIDIVIQGKESHGAAPQNGIDAIMVAAQVIGGLQSIVSRNVSPADAAVVTIGQIIGGQQRNIIANRVELSGTIRTLDPDTREFVRRQVNKIVTGIAEALGATVQVVLSASYPSLINDVAMTDLVKDSAESLLGKENVVLQTRPTMGVEDFSYFQQKAPGCFFRLGVGNKENGIIHPLHTQLFDIDEEALVIGAAMHAKLAIDFLNKVE
ncbi:MAG TPA: amidohydrolase [Patescibacteria group bacterium]|nr:amidohydrolase [Patescibacteria group bacterium]